MIAFLEIKGDTSHAKGRLSKHLIRITKEVGILEDYFFILVKTTHFTDIWTLSMETVPPEDEYFTCIQKPIFHSKTGNLYPCSHFKLY